MALRFFDGFDGYAAGTDLGGRWAVGTPTLMAPGRFGGQYVVMGGSQTISTMLGTNQPTWTVGAAVRVRGGWSYDTQVIELIDVGNDVQVSVAVLTSGLLQIRRQNGTQLAISTRRVTANTWNYFEFKATIDNTAGAVELRVNGEVWCSASGVDTQQTANAWANQLRLGSYFNDFGFDDVYVCDGTGATQNGFLGDCRVQGLAPAAAGDAGDFVLPSPLAAYASPGAAVASDTPLHFWQLQEASGSSAADTGGGTAAAAAFAGARTVAAGPWGDTATDFSASSVATVAHTADLNLTGDMTVECWCYLNAWTATGDGAVAGRGAASAWSWSLNATSAGATRWYHGTANYTTANAVLPVGRWFHWAAVRAGPQVTVYVDGVVVGYGFPGGTPTSSTHPTLLGIQSNGASPNSNHILFPGRVAYLALYNTALAAARVRNHALWSPVAALTDAAAVADPTYVQAGTVGNQSLFQVRDLANPAAVVHAVQVLASAKKDETGPRAVTTLLKSGATVVAGAGTGLAVEHQQLVQLAAVDPATGVAWTGAAVQALQVGARVTG